MERTRKIHLICTSIFFFIFNDKDVIKKFSLKINFFKKNNNLKHPLKMLGTKKN